MTESKLKVRLLAAISIGVIFAAGVLGFFYWRSRMQPDNNNQGLVVDTKPSLTVPVSESDVKRAIEVRVHDQPTEIRLGEVFRFGEVRDSDIAPLQDAVKLTKLELKNGNITSEALKYLSHLHLQALDISRTKVDDLSALSKMRSLKNLTAEHIRSNDADLEALTGLSLEYLDLLGTRVQNLHALKQMQSLKEIIVSNTPLDSEGMRIISQLKNLKRVSLIRTKIKEQDLQYLVDLPNLQFVYLDQCPNLSKAAVKQFTKQLPGDCNVEFEGPSVFDPCEVFKAPVTKQLSKKAKGPRPN
jgi:hypothetical protein